LVNSPSPLLGGYKPAGAIGSVSLLWVS